MTNIKIGFLKLIDFHLYLDGKSQICMMILTHHNIFIGHFKISMTIYENHWFSKENQRFEREPSENHFFQRKTDIGEEPKRKKTQTEEPQVR